MIRRLNFTGRRRIPRGRVTIRLAIDSDDVQRFSAEFDLERLGFPRDAAVFLEAYSAVSYMRFDFGTVGRRRDPPDTRLTEIAARPLPKFRLKVVDRRKRIGVMLGVADQIIALRPGESEDRRQPLLPVEFCDLDEQVWRLDLDDWPVLELNRRIDGVAEAARSDDGFLALVYPEVVRRILHAIVIERDHTDPDFDESDWTSLWLRFVCALPGMGRPPTSVWARSDRLAWIEDAVQAFCRTQDVRPRFCAALERAEARDR